MIFKSLTANYTVGTCVYLLHFWHGWDLRAINILPNVLSFKNVIIIIIITYFTSILEIKQRENHKNCRHLASLYNKNNIINTQIIH